MRDVTLKFKIEGDSGSLRRSTETGANAMRALDGQTGAAAATLRTFGVESAGAAKALKTIVTIGAAKALAGFVADGLAAADQTAKLARRLNVAAAEMAAWRRAAGLAGTTQEAVTTAVERGARTMLDAANGLTTARLAIEQLGLRVEDLEGLAPDELFERMARAVASVEDPARRMALAQQVFSRGAGQLATLLGDYPATMARARREARLFGTDMSASAAAGVEEASDSISRFSLAAEGLRTQMAVNLSPAIAFAGDAFAALMERLGGVESVAQTATVALAALVGSLAGRAASVAASAASAALAASGLTQTTSALTRATIVYSGATGVAAARIRAAAAAQTALNGAMAVGRGALALVGGPWGLAGAAAGALLYFASSAKSASEQAADLAEEIDRVQRGFADLSKAGRESALAAIDEELRKLRGRRHALNLLLTPPKRVHGGGPTMRTVRPPVPDDADWSGLTQLFTEIRHLFDDPHEIELEVAALTDAIAKLMAKRADLTEVEKGAAAATKALTDAERAALALVPELTAAERERADTLARADEAMRKQGLADDERKAALGRLRAALRATATEEDRLAATGERLLAGLNPVAAAEAALAAQLDAATAALRRQGATGEEITAARAKLRAGAKQLTAAERERAGAIDALAKALAAQGKSEEEVAAAIAKHVKETDEATAAAADATTAREALVARGKDLLDQHEPLRAAEEARADALAAVTAALESMVAEGLIPEAEAKERLAAVNARIDADHADRVADINEEAAARRGAADALADQRDAAGDLLRLLERLTGRDLGAGALGGGLGGLLGGLGAAGGSGGSALAGLLNWGTLRDAAGAYALGQSGGGSGAAGYAAATALQAFRASNLGLFDIGFGEAFQHGFSLQDMGLSALASFAGGKLGEAFGGLFGKTAENNWLGTIGGFAGSIFGGPLGAFLGSTIGGALDALFGGDGYKHSSLGAVVGPRSGLSAIDRKRHRWGETIRAASGLDITAYGYKTPVEDAAEFARGLAKLDEALTAAARAAGVAVDLSGRSLAGFNPNAGGRAGGSFFGIEKNEARTAEEAAAAFVSAWIDAVGPQLSRRARAAFALAGDAGAEELARAFAAALSIGELLDLDVVGRADEAVRELNVGQRSLLDAYAEQTDATRALVDGGVRGAEALQELNAALVRQKQSAAALALAYHAAGEEVAALLGGAARAIRESQLSPEQLYEARRATADALRAELETTTDPERVRRIAADIERAARDAWALLGPDQQARLAEDFAGFLDASAEAAQRRLDAGLEELRDSEATLADAADTMLDAAHAFADGVGALLGGGAGLPAETPPGRPGWDPRTNRPAEVNG